MKLLFSAPTGYNMRELVTPLKELLELDTDIKRVVVLTPAARWRDKLFPDYGDKFIFAENPATHEGYVELLEKESPSVVVTPTSGLDPIDYLVLKAAQVAKLCTATFIASWDNVFKMERRVKIAKYKQEFALADRLFVWNTINRDHLLRLFPHLTADDVIIVGAPRLDFLMQAERIPTKEQLCAALGLKLDGKKLIHVATTELYPMDYVLSALANAKPGLLPAHHIFVSVHPGGNVERHKRYAEKYGVTTAYSFGRRHESPHASFIYNPSQQDIYMHMALFKHADLLINQSSTVTIESVLADVPVINVKFGKRFDWWRWYRSMVYRDFRQHARDIITSGATAVVHSRRELVAATNHYLKDPSLHRHERRALAAKMVTNTEGTAGKTLLDHLKRLAQP